ncbi:MAG: 1-acyl-sn-glycerol-3-phosphate acyltransferase [Chromatiales bacterium]|nr:MAG: 1-acyl-sn-glycerol-3-phosphate acyltransferase [Chromatiales bacterium]
MQLLRSILFTCLLFLTVPPYAFLVIVSRPFGWRGSYNWAWRWAKLMVWLARVLCGLRFEVEGQEHLPDEPSIVLFKHSSAFETIVQIIIIPVQTWVLKRELMWAPFFGWGLAAVQPIAIDRRAGTSAVQQVVDQGLEGLRAGRWVVIFPEGTRMPAGETRRYGLSGALLAQAAGCKVVPVAHDAGDYWPRRGWRKRPGTVRFCVGPPMDPAGREPREFNADVQAWIEAKVKELRVAAGHAAADND